MSMTIAYHRSDHFSFRSCPTRLIIQRIVIILCIIYLSYCQLVQSKIIDQRNKIKNNPIDPMIFDTRQRLISQPNQHSIVNSTSNKPKLCRYYPSRTIKRKPPITSPTKPNISSNPNSYQTNNHEIELTSRSSLVTISKLSTSSLVKSNKLPINYDSNISISSPSSVYLNISSNGLISTPTINSQFPFSQQPQQPQRHHRRHEKHHNQQQQSKCHPIKVHASKSVLLKPSCSKHYVHISGKTVRATSTKHLIDNAFHLTSMGIRGRHEFLVNFKGITTGKFICFNKKGKIVAKDNGQWDISCLFRETYRNGNIYKYRSFYNDNWFLGFDTKGRPIRGTINRHERRRDGSRRRTIAQHCYEFSKIKN